MLAILVPSRDIAELACRAGLAERRLLSTLSLACKILLTLFAKMQRASKLNNYHYNPRLKDYARANRKQMTKSEAVVWKYLLKAKKTRGYGFFRQRPILNYIADYACLDLLLIIEIDGITHLSDKAMVYDANRDANLAAIGFTTLRFDSLLVLRHMHEVAEQIDAWITEREKE